VQHRRIPARAVRILSALVLASGCAGDTGSVATTRVTIDTINGVTFVRSSGEPPAWAVEELVTLGVTASGEEADPQEFGRITGVIGDADGAIYVADASVPEIRVFDESGAFLRRIGRTGSGPAEFRTLQSIGWLGDTLVTLDAGNVRLGLLSRDGRWLGQFHGNRLSGSGLYLHQTSPHELYATDFIVREGRGERVYVRYDGTGVRDTLSASNIPGRGPSGVECFQSGSGAIFFHFIDFSPRLLRQPAPNGERLDVYSSDYRLHFVNASGDTTHVIERDVAPTPVPDDRWDAEKARFQAWKDSLPPVNCRPSTLERPAAMSLIRAVFFDDAQRTWVELHANDGSVFDVFDADGRLAGRVTTPKRDETVPLYVRGDRVYLATRDSMGVPYVKVLRFTGSPL